MNECRVVVLGEEMCKLLELAHTRWVVQISSTACQLLRNQNTREIQTKGQILYMRMLLNFWYGVEDIQLILDLEQHVIVSYLLLSYLSVRYSWTTMGLARVLYSRQVPTSTAGKLFCVF